MMELSQRLHATAEILDGWKYGGQDAETCRQAAAELARLTEENKRLERVIVNIADAYAAGFVPREWDKRVNASTEALLAEAAKIKERDHA
jgi:hypothetical protein